MLALIDGGSNAKYKAGYARRRKDPVFREKNRIRANAWYHANKGRARKQRRAAYLRVNYGLTVEEYRAMVKRSAGRCAICRCRPKRLDIDHNHRTGRVRGLLCNSCNRGIGYLQDNPKTLTAAARYLEAAC